MKLHTSIISALALTVSVGTLTSCGEKDKPQPKDQAENAEKQSTEDQLYALLQTIHNADDAKSSVAKVQTLISELKPEDIEDQKILNIVNEILRLNSDHFYGVRDLAEAVKKFPVDTTSYDSQTPLEVDGYEVDTSDSANPVSDKK